LNLKIRQVLNSKLSFEHLTFNPAMPSSEPEPVSPMLTTIAFDLQIKLCGFLDPSDLLSLRMVRMTSIIQVLNLSEAI
jgi:hypothetical protein